MATSYYVTPSGAGSKNGTSLGNAWGYTEYRASSTPTGGDTVFVSGTWTATFRLATGGTGVGAGLIKFDFSGATMNTAKPRIGNEGANYVWYYGGGYWTHIPGNRNKFYTVGASFGAMDGTNSDHSSCFEFGQTACHDVTIDGFDFSGNSSAATNLFADVRFCYNLTLKNNRSINCGGFCWGDGSGMHDILITANYIKTSINLSYQVDCIGFGDAYKVVIAGNKIIQQSPGDNSISAHNDCIQNYRSSGQPSSTSALYEWVVRNNWIQNEVQAGDGNTSFCQCELMSNGPSNTWAMKTYNNVFLAIGANDCIHNGWGSDSELGGKFINCHNTFIAKSGISNFWKWSDRSSGTPVVVTDQNNVFWAPSSVYDGSVSTNATRISTKNLYGNWQVPTMTEAGAGGSITAASPGFTDQSTDDFRSTVASLMRGTADSTIGSEYAKGLSFDASWPMADMELVDRPSGSWDIGAYQYTVGGDPEPEPGVPAVSRPARRAAALLCSGGIF